MARIRTRREFLVAAAGAAASVAGCGGGRSTKERLRRPNVILVTLDTTRRDRIGAYRVSGESSSPSPSPNLDALAAKSVVFTRAVAASSWTLPSHASLFTGKLPATHSVRYDPEGALQLTAAIDGPEEWSSYRVRPLSRGEVTLASVLSEAGYRTGAVVAGPWMKRVFGLDRGFSHYDDAEIGDVNGRLASSVTAGALRFLENGSEPPRPFFLFLNYFDPHGPYEAPSPFGGSRGKTPADRYDEEVLYMDHHIGRLLEALERMDLYDDSLILVTADHGELLGEHGKMGHGASLFEEEIRVPFFVKYPSGETAPTRSDAPTHHVDALPIILDRLELPSPPGAQGRVPGNEDPARPLVAEVHPLESMSTEGAWRALYVGERKFLWNSLGHHALYDVETDPTEQTNLYKESDDQSSTLLALAERFFEGLPGPGESAAAAPVVLDAETVEALRSLGYVP